MCLRLLVTAAFLALVKTISAANVLGLFLHTGMSHHVVFEPLLRALAERSHHVTTVSFFPMKNPPANYTDISLQGIARIGVETFDVSLYENPSVFHRVPVLNRILKQMYDFQPLANMALNVCEKVLDLPPLVEALKKKYDVILVENFNSDCVLGLLHIYNVKAPIVALLSCNFMPWSPNRIGASDNPSYVPIGSTHLTPRMTLLERIENSFMHLYLNTWFYRSVQLKEKKLIEERFGDPIPDLRDLGKNYSLMLVNTFHALNGVRPAVPGVVEVGGMHLDHTRKVIPRVSSKLLLQTKVFY